MGRCAARDFVCRLPRCQYNRNRINRRTPIRTGDTPMTVDEMKNLLEKSRQHSKENAGKVMMCSDKGPAGYELIQGLITLLEQQQREIEAMKAKFIS
jgi:hypothetical protein